MLLTGSGLVDRLTGRKWSGRTSTKLEGKTPTVLLRRNLPVHHDPSPAFRHSIRSPSTKPRSRWDCTMVSQAGWRRLAGRDAYLSSPRVDGSAPARKPRGKRGRCWYHGAAISTTPSSAVRRQGRASPGRLSCRSVRGLWKSIPAPGGARRWTLQRGAMQCSWKCVSRKAGIVGMHPYPKAVRGGWVWS